MRDLALTLAVAAVVLAGCGRDDDGDGGGATAAPDEAVGTDLRIEVRVDEGAEARVLTLTCDPAGGDHPQAQQACDALAAEAPEVFDPIPLDQVCTMIYGGPQTARVAGTYDGTAVDATFSRENGCELDRWERLGTTFFDVPLQ